MLDNINMNDCDPFEIILYALKKLGYSEDEAANLIIYLVEEQKRFDDISLNIHRMINEEMNYSGKWS